MYFSSTLLFRTLQAILLFLVLSFQGAAQAPPFAWVSSGGGTGADIGYGIAVDGSGNSYVTGSFSGTATFGSTTLISSGSSDVFIAKYDASGNVLWVQKAGGNYLDEGIRIAVDGLGNCYITGYFNVSATFGITTLGSSGGYDMFIAKYDTSGNVLWAKKAGGNDNDFGNGIAADGSGNSYITGNFYGSASFGSTTLSSSGGDDVFIAKYDASGNTLWAQKAGGTSDDIGRGIAVDVSGNSYITGSFQGSATFGSTTLTSSAYDDMFIAKYDDSGNVLWAQKAGGTNYDYGSDISVDSSGNSYVIGTFFDTASFGSITLGSSGGYDVFIAKYDSSGTVLWGQKGGGNGYDFGYSIAVDGSGNSYITGSFQGSATFGNTTLTPSGNHDAFITNYDVSGNVLWAQKAGGASADRGYGIAVDGNGNSYVTGPFSGIATFDSITLTSLSSVPSDIFIAKIGTILGLPSKLSAVLHTYPNPFSTSFQLTLPGSGPATVVLTDVLGREVHRQAIAPPAAESAITISPAAHLPAGIYGLQIRQDGSVKQGKVVKQ